MRELARDVPPPRVSGIATGDCRFLEIQNSPALALCAQTPPASYRQRVQPQPQPYSTLPRDPQAEGGCPPAVERGAPTITAINGSNGANNGVNVNGKKGVAFGKGFLSFAHISGKEPRRLGARSVGDRCSSTPNLGEKTKQMYSPVMPAMLTNSWLLQRESDHTRRCSKCY